MKKGKDLPERGLRQMFILKTMVIYHPSLGVQRVLVCNSAEGMG